MEAPRRSRMMPRAMAWYAPARKESVNRKRMGCQNDLARSARAILSGGRIGTGWRISRPKGAWDRLQSPGCSLFAPVREVERTRKPVEGDMPSANQKNAICSPIFPRSAEGPSLPPESPIIIPVKRAQRRNVASPRIPNELKNNRTLVVHQVTESNPNDQ